MTFFDANDNQVQQSQGGVPYNPATMPQQQHMGAYLQNFNQGNMLNSLEQPHFVHLVVDIGDIVQRAFEGARGLCETIMVYNNQVNQYQSSSTTGSPVSGVSNTGACGPIFIGVYGPNRYGVYTDQAKLSESMQYGRISNTAEFGSYNDALNFARQGVAGELGVDVSAIPPMEHSINWMQRIASSF